MASEYYHKDYKCPFYGTSTKLQVRCEGGTQLCFPDKLSITYHINHICCDDWKSCTIARALNLYYDRKGKEEL